MNCKPEDQSDEFNALNKLATMCSKERVEVAAVNTAELSHRTVFLANLLRKLDSRVLIVKTTTDEHHKAINSALTELNRLTDVTAQLQKRDSPEKSLVWHKHAFYHDNGVIICSRCGVAITSLSGFQIMFKTVIEYSRWRDTQPINHTQHHCSILH